MDIASYLDITPAPLALFHQLDERGTRVRYMVPTADGDFRGVTWAAHAKSVKHCALFLRSLGLQPGDRGAIFAPNSVEWMAAALGLQSAGAVMVPIYPANTPSQAAYVAKHSDAQVLFVDTPALLSRIFELWAEYEQVVRIVTLGAQPIEPGPLLEQMRSKGLRCPPIVEVEKKLMAWSRVQSVGQAHDAEAPGTFVRRCARRPPVQDSATATRSPREASKPTTTASSDWLSLDTRCSSRWARMIASPASNCAREPIRRTSTSPARAQ